MPGVVWQSTLKRAAPQVDALTGAHVTRARDLRRGDDTRLLTQARA
jgi:hypothetical protein